MGDLQCACGYAGDAPEGLLDHFGEVFTPDDDIGGDGRVHAQAAPDRALEYARLPDGEHMPRLVCLCGFGTDELPTFDDHLLVKFITPDRVGTDGHKHMPVPRGTGSDQAGSESPAALLLCPGCCTIEDIPQWQPTAQVATPLVSCKRCAFTFPVLPGNFRQLTYDAMRNHECTGMYKGDWPSVSQAIVDAIHEEHISTGELAANLEALWPTGTVHAQATRQSVA